MLSFKYPDFFPNSQATVLKLRSVKLEKFSSAEKANWIWNQESLKARIGSKETGGVYLVLVAKLKLYNFKQKRSEMAVAAFVGTVFKLQREETTQLVNCF